MPAAPLAARAIIRCSCGHPATLTPVVAAPDGTPLGKTASQPLGQDYTLMFQVAGIEGAPAPAQGVALPPGLNGDDLASTAHDLGDVTGVVQVRRHWRRPNRPRPLQPLGRGLLPFPGQAAPAVLPWEPRSSPAVSIRRWTRP